MATIIGNQSDLLSVLNQAGNAVFMVNVARQPNPLQKPLPYSVEQAAVALVKQGVNKDDARLLMKQDVDGEALSYLTDDALTKMGVPTFGRRVKILRAVQNLIVKEFGNELNSTTTVPVNVASNLPPSQRATATPTSASSNLPPSQRLSATAASNVPPSKRMDADLDSEDEEVAPLSKTAPVARARPGLNEETTDEESSSVEDNAYDSDDDREYDPTALKEEMRREAMGDKAPVKKAAVASGDPDDLFATEEGAAAAEFMAVKPWLGAIVAPSKPPKNDPTPPSKQLRLEWVHGYRAFDSRSNLVYNANGDIVYPVAGVCVVYNSNAKRQKHFFGHDDDVRCLAQHPVDKNVVATGQNATIIKGKGTPPHICVWDSSSSDLSRSYVLKMTQADRAVRAVTFTSDGKYLASVSNDDNHSVKIWEWEKKVLITSSKGDTNPIFLIKSNPKDPKELVSVGKRHCMFWSFDGHKLSGRRGQMGGKQMTFYSIAFSEKGYACLGGEDGGIYVFVGGKSAKVFENIHKGKILSLEPFNGGLISGGSDNRVNVLDKKMDVAKSFTFSNKVSSVHTSNDNLLVGTCGSEVFEIKDFMSTDIHTDENLDAITRGHCDGELWALATAADARYYVTAGEDNLICLWDVNSHRLIKKGIINDKKGKAPAIKKASTTSTHPTNQCARAIAISPNSKHIIVGLNNGEISVFETKSMKRLATVDLNKHGKRQVTGQVGNWIQVIQYSPSGRTCAVGTHGSVICLLDVMNGYAVKGVLKSSNSFISHIDWSVDGTAMQINDGAYELLFYSIDEDDLSNSKQVTNASSFRDVKWYTQTCKLGWPVQGIFQPEQDGQDINGVDASPSRTLLATADDHGNVNLFRYPVAEKGNAFHSFHAHSSHVVTVKFTADEKYVLSTGGHDLSIMQWALV